MDKIEKLVDLLKFVFEKYLVQLLIAIVVATIIYYETPDDFELLKKLGKSWYSVFFVIIAFLILLFIKWIFNVVKKFINNMIFKNKQNKEIEKKNIKDLWNYIDRLDVREKDVVQYFLKNENKVIYAYGNYTLEVHPELFDSSQIESDGNKKIFDFLKLEETEQVEAGIQLFQFKLKDEIYELLKYSKKKYGKISNFE